MAGRVPGLDCGGVAVSWRWPLRAGRKRAASGELRGGTVLECRLFVGGGIARLWTVDPLSLEERVVFVMRAEKMPKTGDDCFWFEFEDVVWAERDAVWGGHMLARVGECSDPMAEELLMRDDLDG